MPGRPLYYASGRTADVIRLARAGLNSAEIADATLLKRESVISLLCRLRQKGIDVKASDPRKGPRDWSHAADIIRLAREGKSAQEIVEATGLSKSYVHGRIYTARKTGIDIKLVRALDRRTKDKL